MTALPRLDPTDAFPPLPGPREVRGPDEHPLHRRVPGSRLEALRETVPDLKAALLASGRPTAVTTCDLITLPYPTEYGLWRAARSPAPYVWITNRMLVVQWDDASGRRRTLLWEPSDHERGEYTPYFARVEERSPLPRRMMVAVHGTVLGHLRSLGIEAGDVDYLAFDHLHTQDVRRHLGTTRPAPDLGVADRPLPAWFPNAQLLVHHREWEALAALHPLQRAWYQPDTFRDLPTERILAVEDDVLLGPGVALIATPGHTLGNVSLVLNTDGGVWVSSENGIAAESWAPAASRLPGLRRYALEWDHEVVLNANTLELTAWQYDSMVLEATLADRTDDGVFPRCFPSSELTPHRLSPLTRPTITQGRIEHGIVQPSAVTTR